MLFQDSLFAQVSDVDGNTYTTVSIGTQVWLGGNLKTTLYNDHTAIPNVTVNATWEALSTAAYCWYNNDAATYKNSYGALYNWFAVNTGKLCPSGWHVPTGDEWATFTTFLGGTLIAGSKLKEAGTAHWNSPNTDATNETGFTALPGGDRTVTGTFGAIGDNGYWWMSTETVPITLGQAKSWTIINTGGIMSWINADKNIGMSVRCINDFLLAILTTTTPGSITINSAQSGGNITSDNGSGVTARGVCWNTSPNPTISNSHTSDGTGIGSFTSSMTGLIPSTTYYVRAYATNSAGTSYGNSESFTTCAVAPTIGTIMHPTCALATGSVGLSGLPASGTWTLTRNPDLVITNGTGTSTTITGIPAGTYTFTVTNASGCTSAASSNVVINAQPATPIAPTITADGPTTFCAGGSVTLTSSAGTSYLWSTGATTASINVTASGSYTVRVTNASGCQSLVSAATVVTVSAIPAAPTVGTITQPTCSVPTGSVVLSGLPAGNWTINPGNISGSTTSTTIPSLTADTHNYTVTNAAGCTSPASADVVIAAQPGNTNSTSCRYNYQSNVQCSNRKCCFKWFAISRNLDVNKNSRWNN